MRQFICSVGLSTLHGLIALSLAACAPLRYGPVVDPDRAQLVLGMGQFEPSRPFSGSSCGMTEGALNSGVIDCFAGAPRIAYFNIDKVFAGKLAAKRPRIVYYSAASRDDEEWIAEGAQKIILLTSDGRHHVAQGYRTLEQTSTGSWALPVMDEFDAAILRCAARSLVKPIEFATLKSYRVADYDPQALESMQQTNAISIDGEYFRPKRGVEMTELRDILRNTPKVLESEDAFECEG